MMRLSLRLCTVAILGLLAAGCTTPDQSAYQQGGRFAVNFFDGEKLRAENGRFLYRESTGLRQLDLLTPLNGVLARIEVTTRETCLTRSSGETTCRPSAGTLLEELIGFDIPVEALGSLLRDGTMPAGVTQWQARVRARHEDGRVKTLTITPLFPNNVKSLSIVAD